MNKRISTQPHCFVSIVGPAGSGKTGLIGRMIGNQEKIISPSFDKIIYFYKHYQQHYDTFSMDCEFKHVDIEFVHGLEWNYLQKAEAQKKRILLVTTDLFDEAAQSKEFLALVVAGRHRNVQLMVLRHKLFQQTKKLKTIDLNVIQLILFTSSRDSEQIGILGRQLGERHITIEAYKRATQKSYGHLMVDYDMRNSKTLRYSSNCSGDEPSIYCSTDQLYLNPDTEFTKLLYS